MQSGINIDTIKQYNASLREYKEKSSKLRAEIEFSQKELDRQCKELSAELGIEVTPDNIKTILDERIAKINNTITVGTEILDRIKAEEKAAENVGSVPNTGVIPGSIPGMAQPGVVTQPIPPTPATSTTVPGVQPPPVAPSTPSISDLMSSGLPPIFQNNGI